MYYCELPAPWGRVALRASERGMTAVRLEKAAAAKHEEIYPRWLQESQHTLRRFLEGAPVTLDDIPIDWETVGGTDFQRRVWQACRLIPYGETRTYSWLAQTVRCPKGMQAVGQALGRNPVALLVPCHRVVAKNGLGGFTGGLEIKEKLLQLERGGQ